MNEIVSDNNNNSFCFTETWLCQDDYICLNESPSPFHVQTHVPRDTDRGSGVAAIFNHLLLINPKPKQNFS